MRKYNLSGLVGILAVSGSMQSACGDVDGLEDSGLRAGTVIVDRQSLPLSAESILWISGSYGADCAGHAPNEPWSLAVSGAPTPPAPTRHEPLRLASGDTSCELVLTHVIANRAGDPAVVTFAATASLVLMEDAWSMPVGFSEDGNAQAPLEFYLSARLSGSDDSDGEFAVNLLHSVDPTSVGGIIETDSQPN